MSRWSTIGPMTRRLITTGAIAGFFGVMVVLMLSDRVPLFVPLVLSGIRALGRRAEAITGIDVIDREQIPWNSDLLGHAALWFCGMILIGLAVRKRISVSSVALVLMAIGIGFEFAQRYWTTSRQISVDDAIANSIGVAAGLIVVLVIGGIIDVAGAIRRYLRNRRAWVTTEPAGANSWDDGEWADDIDDDYTRAGSGGYAPPYDDAWTPSAPTRWRYGSGAAVAPEAAPPVHIPSMSAPPVPTPMIEPTQEQPTPPR